MRVWEEVGISCPRGCWLMLGRRAQVIYTLHDTAGLQLPLPWYLSVTLTSNVMLLPRHFDLSAIGKKRWDVVLFLLSKIVKKIKISNENEHNDDAAPMPINNQVNPIQSNNNKIKSKYLHKFRSGGRQITSCCSFFRLPSPCGEVFVVVSF